MTTLDWIVASITSICAIGMATISFRSFNNKGFLFNNEYIYATKQERETMDKRPFYRQTAIVFFILCLIFVVSTISVILKNSRINLLQIPLTLGAIIYAIISSERIRKSKEANQHK